MKTFTAEQLWIILTMRKQGIAHSEIEKVVGISVHRMVDNKVWNLRRNIKRGYFKTINSIAAYAKVHQSDIIELINYEIPKIKMANYPFKIRINDSLENNNRWYSKMNGRIFNAKRKPGYYLINSAAYLKVRQNDCVEIKF